jgi:hypothetical protein
MKRDLIFNQRAIVNVGLEAGRADAIIELDNALSENAGGARNSKCCEN